jgi:hypothetical protein
MKRIPAAALVAGIGLSAVLLPSSPALAKGPTGLRIEGPGLAHPYERSIVTEGDTTAADQAFIEATQMWSLGAHDLCRLPSPPRGNLGEKYLLNWAAGVVTERYGVNTVKTVSEAFYPAAREGAISHVSAIQGVTSGGWFRAERTAQAQWDAVLTDLRKPTGSGWAREGRDLTIRGSGLFRSIGVRDPTAETDLYLSFADAVLGMALWSGSGTCRESAAPTQALGPKYTITWTVSDPSNPNTDTQAWGVQDVYLGAAGGPVIFDHAGSMMNGDSGWFRPGPAFATAWQKLGLKTSGATDRTAASLAPSTAATPVPLVGVAAAKQTAAGPRSSKDAWAWVVLGGSAALIAAAVAVTYTRRRRPTV